MNVELPADTHRIMKLFIDFVYNGDCKLDDMDDVLLLNEVMDRYQLRKGAFYHMCGRIILAKLDPSNYLTLLPKFVSVLNELDVKKATDKVICCTKSGFVGKFNEIKDLPEEVLLFYYKKMTYLILKC